MTKLIQSSDCSSGLIFTAHHADDSDETLLLKLLRGAHLSNLSGMNPITVKSQSIAYARPLLHTRKQDIIQFLTKFGFAWREDESNSSPKYLRNRVRNELLPLIHDIVGGEEIFQKRLENMEEQSKLIKDDLNTRILEYLSKHLPLDTPWLFPVPTSFDFVELNALHKWACTCMKNKHVLEYDQLRRVKDQLISYPMNKRWILNIGKGWNISRKGDYLEIFFDKLDKRGK